MEVEREENDLVLLVDADSLLYYEAFKEDTNDALNGIDVRVKRILEENNASKFVMFLTEGKCFRYSKAIASEYKGNRKDNVKPRLFEMLKGYLKAQYGAYSVSGIEADDAVVLYHNLTDLNTRICSPDKDVLLQTPGTHFNYQVTGVKDKDGNKLEGQYASKGMVTTSEEDAKKFLYLQMLMGDSTDGIPGIEGVGPKKAEKILGDVNVESPKGDVEQLILSAYISKYGTTNGIVRFAETFRMVYLLENEEDLAREGIELPELVISEWRENEVDDDDSVDW